MEEWKLETRITKKLTDMLDNMWQYSYERIDLYGNPYLCVSKNRFANGYWPDDDFKRKWVEMYGDSRPIDICNICNGPDVNSFCVAEIYKRSWNSASYEWKKHNRSVVGY